MGEKNLLDHVMDLTCNGPQLDFRENFPNTDARGGWMGASPGAVLGTLTGDTASLSCTLKYVCLQTPDSLREFGQRWKRFCKKP